MLIRFRHKIEKLIRQTKKIVSYSSVERITDREFTFYSVRLHVQTLKSVSFEKKNLKIAVTSIFKLFSAQNKILQMSTKIIFSSYLSFRV